MSLLSILLWIVMGALAGWAASAVMGTRHQQGFLMDIVVGIAGAFVGGLLLNTIVGVGITGFNLWSLLVAFLGAIILLAAGRALRSATA